MASTPCNNCQRPLSCSCQKKIASDGKSVCANCITAYEKHLAEKKSQQIQ